MIRPLINEASAIANCCKADFILMKLPLLSLDAAADMSVLAGIILPDAVMKNNTTTATANGKLISGKVTISIVGIVDNISMVKNTLKTPILSTNLPTRGPEMIVATPPKKN